MKKKIKNAFCSHLHSLLSNNKASINAVGTLLEKKLYILGVQQVQCCEWKKPRQTRFQCGCGAVIGGGGGGGGGVFFFWNFVSCPAQ